MSRRTENTRRSNLGIFLPQNYGSPCNDITKNISGLVPRRLDFERYAVAGEELYMVGDDSTPPTGREEETRIATLDYALNNLGDPEDATEFMRRLNRVGRIAVREAEGG